uniref:Uncharacterized protein n=1 Tax=Angiostrongylus cantonensis TaxID=6313 RepID=A0A0K0D4Y2_ANGCA
MSAGIDSTCVSQRHLQPLRNTRHAPNCERKKNIKIYWTLDVYKNSRNFDNLIKIFLKKKRGSGIKIKCIECRLFQAKEKNSKLTPEDGDFGTEFSDGEESLPEIDFSTDEKGKNDNEDYYEQVGVFAAQKSVVEMWTGFHTALPEISFSIDGDDESDNEDTLTEIKAVLPSSTLEVVGNTTVVENFCSSRKCVEFKTEKKTNKLPIFQMWTTSTEKPLSLTTFSHLTITSEQTTRNHRKESDYYAMYYND